MRYSKNVNVMCLHSSFLYRQTANLPYSSLTWRASRFYRMI
nr:MAG TPA: hypothetical protein [Caudoviricetes sp.]